VKPEELLSTAREVGALVEGHFLLSSGLHSPRYFQCARLLERPELATRLGAALAVRLREVHVDLTIAPALGGVLVAHEVARALGVRALFAERDAQGSLVLRRGFFIRPDERALVLEDVVTTGRSLEETMQVVRAAGGVVAAAGALVDRSGGATAGLSVPFSALVVLDIPTYSAADCPLCRAGSTPQKPGSRPSPCG
jgi:orotate phosphoribosyltransferase